MKKKKKWLKRRHVIVRNLAFIILYPYIKLKYRIDIRKFEQQGDGPYLILLNHQTPFDQFFCGMAFKGAIYYVATEDIFSKGFLSTLIRFLIAPIPIKKQTTDPSAVLNCLRVAREGGSIAIAPEGNRTYSGKTEYINPSIAPLAKRIKFPIAIFRIEGGYGKQPRWSDVIRKGKMKAYVSRVIEPDELGNMTDDELYDVICRELYVNEAVSDNRFPHKKQAEYLERAIYYCNDCGFAEFKSQGDTLTCTSCKKTVRYLPDTTFDGGAFRCVNDWYEAQCDYLNSTDTTLICDTPVFRDRVSLYEVVVYKKKKLICKQLDAELFGNRISLSDGTVFMFDDMTVAAVLGRNKLNLYFADRVYQLTGEKGFNALKYVNFFYRYKNITNGDKDGKFLGL